MPHPCTTAERAESSRAPDRSRKQKNTPPRHPGITQTALVQPPWSSNLNSILRGRDVGGFPVVACPAGGQHRGGTGASQRAKVLETRCGLTLPRRFSSRGEQSGGRTSARGRGPEGDMLLKAAATGGRVGGRQTVAWSHFSANLLGSRSCLQRLGLRQRSSSQCAHGAPRRPRPRAAAVSAVATPPAPAAARIESGKMAEDKSNLGH
jgi:hypothetical protein